MLRTAKRDEAMSLWHCPTHGLVGPSPCCLTASLARLAKSPTPLLDECNANYRARLAREEAEEKRVLGLEARIRALEATLKEIAEVGCTHGAPACAQMARTALETEGK